MVIKKRMFRAGIRQGTMICLVIAAGVSLLGHTADARVSPTVAAGYDRASVRHHPLPGNPVPMLAKKKNREGNPSAEVNSRVREWNQMSPEEQRRLQQRYQQLQKMSPKERKHYEKRYQQWKRLSPKEREQIRNQLQRPGELSPQEIDMIRRRFKN